MTRFLQLQKQLAKNGNHPFFFPYKYLDRAKEMFFKTPPNEIVLGSYDEEYSTEAVTIPHELRFNGAIYGDESSGKTNLGTVITSQMYLKYGHPTAIIDPKREYFMQQNKNNNIQHAKILKRFGLEPVGFPMSIYTPSTAKEYGDEEGLFQFDLDDFKRTFPNKDQRLTNLLIFLGLGVKKDSAPKRTLMRHNETLPNKLTTLIKNVAQEKKEINEEVAESGKRRKAYSLIDILDSYRIMHVLGREHMKVYFPSEMQHPDGSLGNIIDLQLNIDGVEDIYTSHYLRFILKQIIDDRRRAKMGKGGFLKKPPFIVIDEADLYAPKTSMVFAPARKIIEHLGPKYRAFDISSLLITQKPQFISEKTYQLKYIFTSRFTSPEEVQFMKARGFSDDIIEMIMKRLKFKEGKNAKEFCLVGRGGKYKTFFPLPSPACLFQEE